MATGDAAHGNARLTVRMYDIGFGDSFLLTSRGAGRTWRMLVDCGVHPHGASSHPVSAVVGDIIETCTEGGRARIDVVVATHRHRDHISGFADERWQQVDVGEVWLPWTEDPKDEQANRIRAGHDAIAMSLGMALDAAGFDADLALNSLTNEEAMSTLREGFATPKAKRRYITADPATPHPLKGVPGGRVNFLGPGRDERLLRRMDPTSAERWLSADAASVSDADSRPTFPTYVIDEKRAEELLTPLELRPALRKRLADVADEDALAAVSWLNQAVNNTSVVLLLRVGELSVLLPGDAQWGAWSPLLDTPEVRRLLQRVDLYKVSHHGSHNGTPRTFAEEVLGPSMTSLVSVADVKNWPDIPKKALMDELQKHERRLVLSDSSIGAADRAAADGLWMEIDLHGPEEE